MLTRVGTINVFSDVSWYFVTRHDTDSVYSNIDAFDDVMQINGRPHAY